MRHRQIAYYLLRGKGLEIGAFQRPAKLSSACSITYCDVRSREESLEIFPELSAETLAPVEVISDVDQDGLSAFADASFDFVVFNQVIAHLANPLRAIEAIFRVLKPRGVLVISTHDKLFSFDKKRAAPTFDHLVEEYRQGVRSVSDEHYESFLRAAHPRLFYHGREEIAKALQSVRLRREHAHAWDSQSFGEFLPRAFELLGINAVKRYESLGQDNHLEHFSVWQKYERLDDLALIVADSRRQFERLGQHLFDSRAAEDSLRDEMQAREGQLAQLLGSRTWCWSEPLRRLARRARNVRSVYQQKGLLGVSRHIAAACARRVLAREGDLPAAAPHAIAGPTSVEIQNLAPVRNDPQIFPHQADVDIVVCIHNALDDVRRCLSSLIRHTLPPYSLILVDDGSAAPTRDYLADFAAAQDALLIRNETARGYTFAANQGMHAASGDYVVLLNSDTLVTPDWLDRMAMCAESDRATGMVGPLSNTASWQSIPELEIDGDWACNPLPDNMSADDMAILVAARSARLYPRIPFLNGFCLLIKRALIEDIGYFDEDAFGRGYGEENDYSLRARKAGWQLAVADDAYIFHAQSKSYSHEQRKVLCDLAGAALAAKHGHEIIEQGVSICREDRVLQGLRARARVLLERQDFIERGLNVWEGRRVLFVMPVMAAGGGANVVISEARAMIAMGVDARILSLEWLRESFESSYPELDIPVIYADGEESFAAATRGFDAVVATANHTVQWLVPLAGKDGAPVIGYYVQDFEPYFYEENSEGYCAALQSYSAITGMRCFTKTTWNRDEVTKMTGVPCAVVGPSYETETFMPRRNQRAVWPERPLRVCAMVRPSSERREPLKTMRVLRTIQRAHGPRVEIVIFGVAHDDPKFLPLPRDFDFTNLGEQTPWQMAALLNEVDIFADFSSYQAMGLTAMEAMSCGVAVIVPRVGGADSFARHEENALMIDTTSEEECCKALESLLTDHPLRQRLQHRAMQDVARFYPERAAFNALDVLFGRGAS